MKLALRPIGKPAPPRPRTPAARSSSITCAGSIARARSIEPAQVIDELLAAGVRGRGGAGFPMGRKASFIPKPEQTSKPIYLTVNADESEPGTFKDREIMLRVPHRLIEGCLITAHAIQSQHVFIYIRGEYLTEFEIIRAA